MPKFYTISDFDGSGMTVCPQMSVNAPSDHYAECVPELCEWWIPGDGCSQGHAGIGQLADAIHKLNERVRGAICDAGKYIDDCI